MELEHNKWVAGLRMDYPVDSILASHPIGLLPSKFLRAKKPRRPDTPTATQNVAEILVILDPAAQIFCSDTEPTWSSNTKKRMNLDRFPLWRFNFIVEIRRTHGLLSGISSTKKLVIPPWFSDTRRLIQVSHWIKLYPVSPHEISLGEYLFRVLMGEFYSIIQWSYFFGQFIIPSWLILIVTIVIFHCIPLHMMVLVSS